MKFFNYPLTLLSVVTSGYLLLSSPTVQAFTESELQQITSKVNEQLPIVIDGFGRFDSLTVVNKNTLSFNYTDLEHSSQQYTPEVVKEVNQAIRNHACKDESASLFFKEGISLQFRFQDTSKKLLTQVLIKPSECGY